MKALTYSIHAGRLNDNLQILGRIGKIGSTGVSRLAHSPEDKEAVLHVKKYMDQIGLKTEIDQFGNLIGRMDG